MFDKEALTFLECAKKLFGKGGIYQIVWRAMGKFFLITRSPHNIFISLKFQDNPYEILQDSVEFYVECVSYDFTAILDVLYYYVSSWRHGVRGQKSDDDCVLSSVRNRHCTGDDDITSTQDLVVDIL